MKTLGIVVSKDIVRHVVLVGTRDEPQFVDSQRHSTPDPRDVPALVNWYESYLEDLLREVQPLRIGYKLIINPTLVQQHYISFPMGILNLVAARYNIQIAEYSQSAITPKKLGLERGTNLMDLVDESIGVHPPYWDKNQREAALLAWFLL